MNIQPNIGDYSPKSNILIGYYKYLIFKNFCLNLNFYFQFSNGLFISIVFSVPLILNSCLIVIIWLYECYLLLIEVVKLKKKSAQNHALKKDD